MKKLLTAMVPVMLVAGLAYSQPGPSPCGNNNCTVTTLTATKKNGASVTLQGDAGIRFGDGTIQNTAASGSGGGGSQWRDAGNGGGTIAFYGDVNARTLTLDGGGGNVMALGLPTGGWECFDTGVCDARMWYDGNDLKVSSGIGSHFYSNIPIVDHGALAVRADDSRPRLDIDTRTGGNVTFTPSGTDPSIGFELYPVGNGATTIINSADGGVRWGFGDAGMTYPDGTYSGTAGATSGLVQWDAQATTTPNVGSALTSYHSTSVSGFWFHVDTTSGNQLQLVADGGSQASDKTAGFITSDTLPSADYRVRSMIQLCASTLTSSCDRFAVIARASQSGGALTAYYFTISGFTGATAATVGLYKIVADSFTAIGPTAVTLATYFPGIAPGDYVAADLEVHGGNIRGYINGRLVASGYDTSIAAAGGGGVVIQPAVGSSTMAVINVPFFGLLPYAPFNY